MIEREEWKEKVRKNKVKVKYCRVWSEKLLSGRYITDSVYIHTHVLIYIDRDTNQDSFGCISWI